MMLHRNNPRSTHVQEHPISRTIQYKKVTKPLLERKRRARINRCLDELKDLMVGALEAEVENVNKLEKADILELTVRHLQRITKPRDPAEEAQRFQAGFNQCASEACGFLLSLPGLDSRVGRRLVSHLGHCLTSPLSVQVSSRHHCYSPPCSPAAPHELSPRPHTRKDFYSPFTTVLSAHDLTRPINGLLMTVKENDDDSRDMWRPW